MSKTYLGAKRKRTNTPAENRKRTVEYRHLRYAKKPVFLDEEETVIVLPEAPEANVSVEAEETVVVLPETEETAPVKPAVMVSEPVKENTEKGGFFARVTAFFAGLFGALKSEEDAVVDETVRAAELLEVPADSDEPVSEKESAPEEPAEETAESETETEAAAEETESSEETDVTETPEEAEDTEERSEEPAEETETAESEEAAEETEAPEATAEGEAVSAEETETAEETGEQAETSEEENASETSEEPVETEKAETAEEAEESETSEETVTEEETSEDIEENLETETETSEETTEEAETSEEETASETSEEKAEEAESAEEKKEETESSEKTEEVTEMSEEEKESEPSEEKEEGTEPSEEKEEAESSEEKKEETESSEETEEVKEETEKTDEEKKSETSEEKEAETAASDTEETKEKPSEPEKPKKSLYERFLEFKAYRRRKKLENLDEMIDRPTANILQMMIAPGSAMERVSKAGYATVSRFTILAFNILKWIIFGAFFGSFLRMIISSVEFSIVQMNFSSASGVAVKIALFTLAAEYLSYYLISIASGLMRKQITMPVLIDVTGRSSLSTALIFLVACFVLKHNMALGFAIVVAGLIYEIAMKTYGIGLVAEDISRNIQFWFIALLVVIIAMLSFTYFRMTMSNVVEIFSKIMNLN